MISFKTIAAICLGAALCSAQTDTIRGFVKDTANNGIPDATVKLEIAGISTTTGANGSFTLTGLVSVAKPGAHGRIMGVSPISFQKGKIALTLSQNALVGISIHDLGGRQLYSNKKMYSPGTHAIKAPVQSNGILIYKISIGNDSYSFKASVNGTFSAVRSVASRISSALAKKAQATEVFSDIIAVTSPDMLHYRRVIGTSDTSGLEIIMIPNAGDVSDTDGNIYQSVQIGNQVWTVENLRSTKFNDGAEIPLVAGTSAWGALTTPGRCWYNNDSASNHATYGILYNWYAVNTGKLAPEGWRVPSTADWDSLLTYLITNGYNWDTTSANKIGKSLAAQTEWNSTTTPGKIGDNLGKNNTSGFSALPGGYCNIDGFFNYQGNYGYWWSATEFDESNAYFSYLLYSYENLGRDDVNKSWGFSVRLVRDSD